MRVRWLRAALRNLDDEATYISEDDPAAALRVVQRVMQAVALLEEQPGIGRPGRVPGTLTGGSGGAGEWGAYPSPCPALEIGTPASQRRRRRSIVTTLNTTNNKPPAAMTALSTSCHDH